MKDNIVGSIILIAFILWQFVILFGLFGGSPEGAFVKIAKLGDRLAKLEARIIEPGEYE